MMNEKDFAELAEMYRLFGSVPRLKIICALRDGERTVSELMEAVGLSQSAVSHQLRDMKYSHIVKSRRDGLNICYSLDDSHILGILGAGIEHIEHMEEEEYNHE